MVKFTHTVAMNVLTSAKCPKCSKGHLHSAHRVSTLGIAHICNNCEHEEHLPEIYPQYKHKRVSLPEEFLSDYN